MRKNRKVWKIAVPAGIFVAVAVALAASHAKQEGEALAEAMEVEAMAVEKGNVSETIETNGIVVSGEHKTIFPQSMPK